MRKYVKNITSVVKDKKVSEKLKNKCLRSAHTKSRMLMVERLHMAKLFSAT